MRVIEISTTGLTPSLVVPIADHAAMIGSAGLLRVVDLRARTTPVLLEVAATAVGHARGTDDIYTLDREGVLACWRRAGERWRREPVAGPRRAGTSLTVSRSGRFAVVEGEEAVLVDLASGEDIAQVPSGPKPSRSSFGVLASGREVLFAARPGYMDVRVLDAATGRLLRVADHSQREGFCHVELALGAGGSRLASFGCMWAAPYEAHLYDVSSWLSPDATPLQADLPPPMLVLEPVVSNTQMAIQLGAQSSIAASIEDCADLRPGEHDPDPLDLLREHDPALAAELERQLAAAPAGATHLLIVRAIDVARGTVERTAFHPLAGLAEARTHCADGGRVVTFGDRLVVSGADGERVDHGPLRLAAGARTAVTPDGTIGLIVTA